MKATWNPENVEMLLEELEASRRARTRPAEWRAVKTRIGRNGAVYSVVQLKTKFSALITFFRRTTEVCCLSAEGRAARLQGLDFMSIFCSSN